MTDAWRLFHGDGRQRDDDRPLPEPPPWRRFGRTGDATPARPRPYLIDREQADVVNAALHLRRPLLVTGRPGTGKSSLAEAIAHELRLGPVLQWSVNSKTVLTDGLYQYDAVGRLRESTLAERMDRDAASIGTFIRLGPVGTALAHPGDRPRVLLVDELDKGDGDLPNDLLTVFEQGFFDIPELVRLPEDQAEVEVFTADQGGRTARISRGEVVCAQFPVVIITSNGERDFPPAFLRRCLQLHLPDPTPERLRDIVEAHLGPAALARSDAILETFVSQRAEAELATDQLLNAVFLRSGGVDLDASGLLGAVLHHLGPN